MGSDVTGTGLNRDQLEALEEMAMLLQDAGFDLQKMDHLDLACNDLEVAAQDLRFEDFETAAQNIESAVVELEKINTHLLGSQIQSAGAELQNFIEGER